jgi:hypothetical protein
MVITTNSVSVIPTNSVSIISTKYIFSPYWLKRYEIIQSLKEVCSTKKQCKMSSSKNIDLSRDFAAGVYLSDAQNPIPTPPPLHTVYVYTGYLFTKGSGWGGELNQREV